MSSNDDDDEKHTKTTKFKKGQSGNPKGRPKGTKNKETLAKQALEDKSMDLMLRELPKIVQVCIEKAKQGDMNAMKMVLDRAIPTKKAVEYSTKDGKDLGINIIVERKDDYVQLPAKNIIEHDTEE